MIHPLFGGNKWRKLKYNIEAFKNSDHSCIVSFGGTFSNHISALAHICDYHNIPCVGLIRTDTIDEDNPTLQTVRKCGMKLHSVSRAEYRLKEKSEQVQDILDMYPGAYLVPEGGSNRLARQGVSEILEEFRDEDYDYVMVAAGTGMTAAGIITSLDPACRLIAVNVLKNRSLDDSIKSYLEAEHNNWQVDHEHHFGGYAKVPDELIEFYHHFYTDYKIELDPVYNAKLMYAAFDLIKNGDIAPSSRVLCIHTGGLQGIRAYEYLSGKVWTPRN